jgi:hypothetical protein
VVRRYILTWWPHSTSGWQSPAGLGRRHSPSEVLKLGDLREAVVVGLRKEQLFIKHFKQKWVQYLSNCTEVMSTLVFSFNQWVGKRFGCHSFSFQVISPIQSSILNCWWPAKSFLLCSNAKISLLPVFWDNSRFRMSVHGLSIHRLVGPLLLYI